jgi:hypothetical protein
MSAWGPAPYPAGGKGARRAMQQGRSERMPPCGSSITRDWWSVCEAGDKTPPGGPGGAEGHLGGQPDHDRAVGPDEGPDLGDLRAPDSRALEPAVHAFPGVSDAVPVGSS